MLRYAFPCSLYLSLFLFLPPPFSLFIPLPYFSLSSPSCAFHLAHSLTRSAACSTAKRIYDKYRIEFTFATAAGGYCSLKPYTCVRELDKKQTDRQTHIHTQTRGAHKRISRNLGQFSAAPGGATVCQSFACFSQSVLLIRFVIPDEFFIFSFT